MEHIVSLLSYFCMISIAAERFVEMLKKTVLKNAHPPGVVYQTLSALFGGTVSLYSPPPSEILQLGQYASVIVTGLAISGGSSFWNTALDSFSSIAKNLKEANP